MTGCVACGCTNRPEKGFIMKAFPRDPIRRNQWVAMVKRDGWYPTESSRICEAHFEPCMWEKVRVDGKRILRCNAVPTIFFHQEPLKRRKPPITRKPCSPKMKKYEGREENTCSNLPDTAVTGTMDVVHDIKCEPEDLMENGEGDDSSIMSTVEEVNIKTEGNEDILLAEVKSEIPEADIEIKDEVLEPSECYEQSMTNFPSRSAQHVSVAMASDEEECDVKNGTEKHLDRALLVRLISKHTVVLERSQMPAVVSSKRRAWTTLTEEFSNAVGKKTTVGQLKKMLNNMKTRLKKKMDLKATGDSVIKLKDWEKDFLGILDKAANPVVKKIPGSLSAEIKRSEDSSSGLETKSVVGIRNQSKDCVEKIETGIPPKRVRKSTNILAMNETEETKQLSLLELKLLVLQKQSEIMTLKIQRREKELKKIKQSRNERCHRDQWTQTN